MRIVVILLLILGEASLLAIQHETSAVSNTPADKVWVRTLDGWESLDSLRPREPKAAKLHPLPVAAVVLMSSLLVLLSSPSDQSAPQMKTDEILRQKTLF